MQLRGNALLMIRGNPWRYGPAALTGVVSGALLFVLIHIFITVDPAGQLRALIASIATGVVIGCISVFVRNQLLRLAYQRHEQERGVSIVREPNSD